MTNFLGVKQVSELLGISEKTVYRKKAEIPGYFRLANMILFDREILLEELKKRAKQSGKTVPKLDGSRHGI